MSLALFRKWLRQKIEHRVVPSVVFGSERLAFRRLGLADMATQRARLTPGCVADMCTTAGISAIRMSSARPSGSLMRYGEAARSSACSPSTRLMDLSAYGSPPSTRPRYGSEVVRSFLARPEFNRLIHSAGCFEDNRACRRIIEGNGFTEERRVVIATPFCARPRVGLYYSRLHPLRPTDR